MEELPDFDSEESNDNSVEYSAPHAFAGVKHENLTDFSHLQNGQSDAAHDNSILACDSAPLASAEDSGHSHPFYILAGSMANTVLAHVPGDLEPARRTRSKCFVQLSTKPDIHSTAYAVLNSHAGRVAPDNLPHDGSNVSTITKIPAGLDGLAIHSINSFVVDD